MIIALPFFCPKSPLMRGIKLNFRCVFARFKPDLIAAQYRMTAKIMGLPGQSVAKLGRLKPLGPDAAHNSPRLHP